ncbi:hypothetical protein WDW37_14740 [Bdellovibrionota bacterium FG-1]
MITEICKKYLSAAALLLSIALIHCGGGTGTGNPGNIASSENLTLQSAPLAGSSAASIDRPHHWLESVLRIAEFGLEEVFFGARSAFATVSSFGKFNVCNDTLIFLDGSGKQLSINGTTQPSVGRGLLSFSASSTQPMTIGNIAIPTGTIISEIDITFAVVPAVCAGANYAVEFDNGIGGGVHDITQNTAFKFNFASNYTITGKSQTITLLFGAIVSAMAQKGVELDDNTIQTLNVGQAE